MIEDNPRIGYRTVAHLLGFNKNTVQRVVQLRGWQVLKPPVGFRPRIVARRSRASQQYERWAAPEQALIARFGTLGRVKEPFFLRSDNGLVFSSRRFVALAKAIAFITLYTPQQNRLVERMIRSSVSTAPASKPCNTPVV